MILTVRDSRGEKIIVSEAKTSPSRRQPKAKPAQVRATFGALPDHGEAHVREPLSAAGRALLEQLEGKLPLRRTAKEVPHIINRLAAFGYRPAQMVHGIDALLIADRTDRQGFPFEVLAELSELRAFYARFLNA